MESSINAHHKLDKRHYTLLLLAILSLICLLFLDPVPQDPHYHNFSDCRCIAGVYNFWNVVSNLPFLIVGIIGLIKLFKYPIYFSGFKTAYTCFCIGIILTAFGSSFYHYSPYNESLVWDRIPMTIIFMSLLSIIISGCIDQRFGKLILFPLLITGITSVFYWHFTEQKGMGDLRFYAYVQFFPILIIPIILFLFPSKMIIKKYLLIATLFYIIAKVFEDLDQLVFVTASVISGHSLKHIIAAIAIFFIVKSFSLKDESLVIK